MWKYIGIQIGYALSGESWTGYVYSVHGDDFVMSVFHTAWGIYTLIAMVVGLAIALLYICLVVFTDWIISSTLTLL